MTRAELLSRLYGIKEHFKTINNLAIGDPRDKEIEAIQAAIEELSFEKAHAEWLNPKYNILQCSRCGYTTSAKSRFCPGCGVEMKEEQCR